MLLTKRIILSTAVILGSFALCAALNAKAYDINFSPQNLPPISIPTTINTSNLLPAPVSNFINSLEQIGESFVSKASNINFSTAPQNIVGGVNNWFQSTTGISLTQVIRVIGNLMVWVLSTAASLIKWALSFL